MQLFITDFEQKEEQIIISNSEVIEQCRKVLRMKLWDVFFVQKENTRLQLEFVWQEKNSITGKILETVKKENKDNNKISMLIAMPNKWQKLELIVQKLSEIGVRNIYIWSSERSVLKSWNKNKWERLLKISKEAVEQSRWWELPKIEYITDIQKTLEKQNIIIFDKNVDKNNNLLLNEINNFVGIVWPEGGLTIKDYENFWKKYLVKSLWETVLRMETASIIWAWILKNEAL